MPLCSSVLLYTGGVISGLLLLEKNKDIPIVEWGTGRVRVWLWPEFKHQSHFGFC